MATITIHATGSCNLGLDSRHVEGTVPSSTHQNSAICRDRRIIATASCTAQAQSEQLQSFA